MLSTARPKLREGQLIPREHLIDAVGFSAPRISPDGTRIAFLGPHRGARNAWIAPADKPGDAAAVTNDTTSAIRDIYWAETGEHLILVRDAIGDEQTQIVSVALSSGSTVVLSPCAGAQTRLVAMSATFPDEILIESNDRDPAYFDVYRANILTGASRLILRNERFTWIYADHFLRPRLAELRMEDGSVSYERLEGGAESQPLIRVPAEDEATRPFRIYEIASAFSADASEIYAMDSRGRDTSALAAWNLTTGAVRVIAADPRADIIGVLVDPGTHELLACASDYVRPLTTNIAGNAAGALEALRSDPDIEVAVVSQSRDNRRWIVSRAAPHIVSQFVLLDRSTNAQTPLFVERPELDGLTLARMHPYVVKSRDGLDLVCYVTLPPEYERDAEDSRGLPAPMVVLVHGGPWIRDTYTQDSWIQLLANRGYAVLNVNFRGSRGFGKAFLNAGDREWGNRMLDDVVDAVKWCIGHRIADSKNLALMGASFGGYTTLMGMAREPELFKCGVDVFGVANLESFLETMPPHWKALVRMWMQRVGDWTTPAGRAFLKERSPLHYAARIKKPILICQGGNDPRVVQAESDQMVAALKNCGVEVTYLLYPDEGHSFYQTDNQLSFFAAVEAFLAKHLGGRCEALEKNQRRPI